MDKNKKNTNIADRKKAENEKEEINKVLFTDAPEGILVVDMQTKQFQSGNPAICRMLGYEEEELKRLFIENIYPKESLDQVLAEFEALMRGEKKFTEVPCLRKDGTLFNVSITASKIALNGHDCILGFFSDITERKRTNDALIKNELRFRIMFENSRDAIMTIEPPSWNFTTGNPATIKMFMAKDEEDFISHGPGELSPEHQADGRLSGEKAKAMIDIAMRDGSIFFEWTHRRLNGEDFPATVLLTRMELPGKVFCQATVRDITEQKKAEKIIQEKIKEVEKMNDFMVSRETKMIDLQYENEELKNKLSSNK